MEGTLHVTSDMFHHTNKTFATGLQAMFIVLNNVIFVSKRFCLHICSNFLFFFTTIVNLLKNLRNRCSLSLPPPSFPEMYLLQKICVNVQTLLFFEHI